MSYKSVPQEFPTRVSRKSVPQECPTRVSHKSIPQECPTRVSYKSVPQECPTRVSHESVLQECPTRVSYKSAFQECPTRVSCKSVSQECPTRRVTHKSILQECPTRVSYKSVIWTYVAFRTCLHSGSWAPSCTCFFLHLFTFYHPGVVCHPRERHGKTMFVRSEATGRAEKATDDKVTRGQERFRRSRIGSGKMVKAGLLDKLYNYIVIVCNSYIYINVASIVSVCIPTLRLTPQ